MLNIVVPMAGRGSRFANAGYELPKPLIPVHGKPMIRLVIENLRPSCKHRFIFLCLQEHVEKYQVKEKLISWAGINSEVVVVDKVTDGAACTVLLAKELINNNDALMIANSDQWVDLSIDNYLNKMDNTAADGLIMTMWADDPKWSFVRLDEKNEVTEVVEKKVISNDATVGIYNYRNGKLFVDAAESMINKNLRVNNEFYVAPTYNEMILRGAKIVIYNVGKEMDGMYGIGIPEDLKKFEALAVSRKAVNY